MGGWLAFLLTAGLVLVAASHCVSAGSVTLQASGLQANNSPDRPIPGALSVSYDILLPRSAVLQAFIDGNKVSEIPLYNYTHDAGYYSYATRYFSYNLTSRGSSAWFDYPSQQFSYRPKAQGTCGGNYCFDSATGADNCLCPASCANHSPTQKYPCSWSLQLTGTAPTSTVKGNEGLKFIYDAATTLSPPLSANDYTLWSDEGNANPAVEVSLRAACGNEYYLGGHYVWGDGWVRRTISSSDVAQQPGTNYRDGTLERFDNASLGQDRNRFEGGPGGIYKDGVYQPFGGDSGAYWNGTTGYIRIYNYNPDSACTITYMPPNGGRVCAYTNAKTPASNPWDKSYSVTGAYCSFKQPYVRNYTQAQLDVYMQPTACPAYVDPSECNKSGVVYGAVKTGGPADVMVSFDGNLAATAYTTSRDLAANYSFESGISLASFPNLRAPSRPGPAILEFRIASDGSVLGAQRFNLSSCIDADGDGYCSKAEGGSDCDDGNAAVHTGAAETCNGIDDDCNDKADEGFSRAGKTLGMPCNNWDGSACAGFWVCTPDGSNVTCKAGRVPGELKELCGNGIDDDCDGRTDEDTETSGGRLEIGCFCDNGRTKACGSNVGACKAGYQLCVGSVWSDCKDAVLPATEKCNNKDDDCDGTTDNAGGGISVDSTKCGCYGGALPAAETCNGLDDNCNGAVDDGIECCSAGETRPCGLSNGACKPGVEACRNSRWSGVCEGGVQPGNPSVDGSCNRVPDCRASELVTETCVCGNSTMGEGFCCGGLQSNAPCSDYNFSMWLVIAGGAMLLVVAFWIVAIRGAHA